MVDATHVPMEEWPLEELAHLEDALLATFGADGGGVFRDLGAVCLAGWVEGQLRSVSAVLDAAGVPMVPGAVRARRRVELRVVAGGAA